MKLSSSPSSCSSGRSSPAWKLCVLARLGPSVPQGGSEALGLNEWIITRIYELCQACNDVEEIKLRKAETAALGQFQKLDEIMKIYMLVDKVLFMSCFPTYSIEISWFR
ncbi:hypothetical protein Y1Q_0003731 [Alligator mississippiensis]|uniref:Uncharacterized protein n=1 Tax=Alligator mississippiensis TaxID=8496 RepID=A0A151MNH2_ALLMI|nr:hypothetical protein Y1Q_0003731 [Alligator mississippiensis]